MNNSHLAGNIGTFNKPGVGRIQIRPKYDKYPYFFTLLEQPTYLNRLFKPRKKPMPITLPTLKCLAET